MSAGSTCTAARSAMVAGQFDHARQLLDEALAGSLDDADRLDALGARARLAVVLGDGAQLLPELERVVAETAVRDPQGAGALLLDVVILKLYALDRSAVEDATRARALTRGGDRALQARADTVLGLAHAFAGDAEEASRHLLRGADLARVGGAADEVAFLLQQVVVGLASTEQYAAALAVARRYLRSVRSVGAEGMLPTVLCYLANSAYFTGDFDEMAMAATEAFRLAGAGDQGGMAGYALACRAVVGGLRGEPEAVGELEEAVTLLVRNGAERIQTLPLMGMALAALTEGDYATAVERYATLRSFDAVAPVVPGLLHWRADEVEALWRAGRESAARAALAELLADVTTHGPWERAAAARASALLAVDARDAEASFAEALRWHEQSTSPFERARTELCLGEWLVHHGRADEARAHLESAAATFAALDTRPWHERATALLGASGPRGARRPAARTVVRAFGPLTVVHGDVETRVGLDARGRLLCSLVAAGGAIHAERLVDLMWPEAPRESGGARLRTVLARLRRSYGPIVVRDGSLLRWADDVEVDVERFGELVRTATDLRTGARAAAAAGEAVGLYRAELLPLERYAEDVAVARERLRQQYLQMLDLLADHEVAEGRPDGAAGFLSTAIDADPVDESRYARLAALLMDQGQHGRAHQVLEAAARTVADLGLPLSPRLVSLRRRLEAADPAPPA